MCDLSRYRIDANDQTAANVTHQKDSEREKNVVLTVSQQKHCICNSYTQLHSPNSALPIHHTYRTAYSVHYGVVNCMCAACRVMLSSVWLCAASILCSSKVFRLHLLYVLQMYKYGRGVCATHAPTRTNNFIWNSQSRVRASWVVLCNFFFTFDIFVCRYCYSSD